MGTAILRSHDCLQRRFLPNDALSVPSSPIPSRKNCSPNPNCKSYVNQNRRRKRSPVSSPPVKQTDRRNSGDRSAAPVNLVMGQVKILKRGEKLSPEISDDGGLVLKAMDLDLDLDSDKADLVLGSTDRFGPDPVAMQEQIRISESNLKNGIYAGSAFFSSPPPSSVPVPFFLRKNGVATSDLRRLLRLDLE